MDGIYENTGERSGIEVFKAHAAPRGRAGVDDVFSILEGSPPLRVFGRSSVVCAACPPLYSCGSQLRSRSNANGLACARRHVPQPCATAQRSVHTPNATLMQFAHHEPGRADNLRLQNESVTVAAIIPTWHAVCARCRVQDDGSVGDFFGRRLD